MALMHNVAFPNTSPCMGGCCAVLKRRDARTYTSHHKGKKGTRGQAGSDQQNSDIVSSETFLSWVRLPICTTDSITPGPISQSSYAMAEDDIRSAHEEQDATSNEEESRSFLSASPTPSDLVIVTDPPYPYGSQRQSSLAQPRRDGLPRTPNRVRFDIDDIRLLDQPANGHAHPSWMNEEDYLDEEGSGTPGSMGIGDAQTIPLLTDIEAPSVTLATEGDIDGDGLDSSRPKSGMSSAFMNMANSIIGAGIIGQPYAIRQAGLFTGIFLLVALTITVDWTIQLIVINSKLSGANSFQGTVEHCYGKAGLIAISIAQWAFAFGGMIAFCIIVGDTIPHVMAALFPSLEDMSFLWLLTDRRAVIAIFILGISFPLSLYRDIAKLAKASTLALISMLVILVTVITQGFRIPSDLRGPIRGSLFINSGVFQAIGVISFAFVCHHNSLLIYGSLKKPTLDRFALVTHYSTGISMVACLVMALAGYLTFGSKTQGNLLNNFPADNVVVNIARFCFGLNMLTTLPLEAFVCREVMTRYYFPGQPFNRRRHVIFTTSLVVGAVSVSLVTCDVGVVFELIGSTSACALAYILPPLCYIRLASRSWRTVVAMVCVAFGGIVMTITLVLAVGKMISNEGEVKVCS